MQQAETRKTKKVVEDDDEDGDNTCKWSTWKSR